MIKTIGVLTGGGDCPGLNPAIRWLKNALGQEQIQAKLLLQTEVKFLQLEKLLISKIVSFMNLRMGKLNQ